MRHTAAIKLTRFGSEPLSLVNESVVDEPELAPNRPIGRNILLKGLARCLRPTGLRAFGYRRAQLFGVLFRRSPGLGLALRSAWLGRDFGLLPLGFHGLSWRSFLRTLRLRVLFAVLLCGAKLGL